MPAPPYPQPRRALPTFSLTHTAIATTDPIIPEPAGRDLFPTSCLNLDPRSNIPSALLHDLGRKRAFSFARDTKASIARAAKTRYPSAPLRRPLGIEGGKGKGESMMATSRPVTPTAKLGAAYEHHKYSASRPVTPASPGMPVTPSDTPRAGAKIGKSPMSPASTPKAKPTAISRTSSRFATTPTKSSAATSVNPSPSRASTPAPNHLTPRSKPLPFLPASHTPTTTTARAKGATSAMSFYDRLSSLTSSTRGTVGRAHSMKEQSGRQGARWETKPSSRAADQGGVYKTEVERKVEQWGERNLSPRQGPNNGPQPQSEQARAAGPPHISESAPRSNVSKASRSSNWLKRMRSTTFPRTAARISSSYAASSSTSSSPARRIKRVAPMSLPRTPERKGIEDEAIGGGSPWISARTLAAEGPVDGINQRVLAAAPGALCVGEQAPGQADGEHCRARKGVDDEKRGAVGVAQIPWAARRCLSVPEPARKTSRRKPAPSLSSSHLRDIEQQWLKAIEVEVMSAAEGECLAGAQCISVYDPWSDSAVHDLYRLTAATAYGLVAGIRAVPKKTSEKRELAPAFECLSAPAEASTLLPGALPSDTAPQRETHAVQQASSMSDERSQKSHDAEGRTGTTAELAAPCLVGMIGLHRSATATSALSTTSTTSTSSLLLSTPTTPNRKRHIGRRLKGDMRDDLDYLYDTFTLDDEDDADITITSKWDCLANPRDADETFPISPWQLVRPSPQFSRPHEGIQTDEEWVVTTPVRKVRGLRRVDTLGSLRSH